MAKSSETLNALRFAWVGLCLVVLAFMLSSGPNPEGGIIFVYAMLALTFPIGFAAAYIFAFVSIVLERFYGYVVPYDPIANGATWALFVAFGYLQWFVLLPWVIRRFRGRGTSSERVL